MTGKRGEWFRALTRLNNRLKHASSLPDKSSTCVVVAGFRFAFLCLPDESYNGHALVTFQKKKTPWIYNTALFLPCGLCLWLRVMGLVLFSPIIVGITFGSAIICGPIWGLFAVPRSFHCPLWYLKANSHLWDKHKHKHNDVHTSDIRMCNASHIGSILILTYTRFNMSKEIVVRGTKMRRLTNKTADEEALFTVFMVLRRRRCRRWWPQCIIIWIIALTLCLFHASSHLWNKHSASEISINGNTGKS